MYRFLSLLVVLVPLAYILFFPKQAVHKFTESNVVAAQAMTKPLFEPIQNAQPQWITVEPRSKPECLKESGGALNPVYVRCINGYQKQISINSQGHEMVLSERAISLNIPR